MKRKCLAVGIILLFVGTCIIPAIAQDTEKPLPTTRGSWLYVGGDGPGNYTKIQDAVDNASDGDTVFVYDDSSPYYEQIVIKKSINLTGENKETTIIDGNGSKYVVFLTKNATFVTINGFTIRNPKGPLHNKTGIYIDTSYNVITGNIIENTSYGIIINYSPGSSSIGSIISHNTITHTETGVSLSYSPHNNNNIFENYIAYNTHGIYVYGISISMTSKKPLFFEYTNDISKNIITNNDFGIVINNYDDYVNVSRNIITNNSWGIYLVSCYGYCANNNIFQNNINGNKHGLFMEVCASDYSGIVNNYIIENNFANNENGIEMICSHRRAIIYNTIYHNNFIGNYQMVNIEYSIHNHWVGNYWGDARLLPYPIVGKLAIWRFTIPWIVFDWRPAQNPYNIPGMR